MATPLLSLVLLLLSLTFSAYCGQYESFGAPRWSRVGGDPARPAEPISIWPMPWNYTLSAADSIATVSLSTLRASSSPSNKDKLLPKVIERFVQAAVRSVEGLGQRVTAIRTNLEQGGVRAARGPARAAAPPAVKRIAVYVATPDVELALGVDESYTITAKDGVVEVRAGTVWGAQWGLESLLQLLDYRGVEVGYVIPGYPLSISDAPAYPWRGLLIDSSRHFQTLSSLKGVVDAMSMIKLNVLHWHLTDSDSFPIDVPGYPELAEAVFAPEARYSDADVAEIVEYARQRGVRVMPEFDFPGHSAALAAITRPKKIVSDCWEYLRFKHPGPPHWLQWQSMALDPTVEEAYDFVGAVIKKSNALFPKEPFLHLGGDEVVVNCWLNDTATVARMKAANLTAKELWASFEKRALAMVSASGRRPVIWEESFEEGFDLPNSTLITVWKTHATVAQAIRAGHDVIVNAGLYLDRQAPACDGPCLPSQIFWMWVWTWRDFYTAVITPSGLTEAESRKILGGELGAWAESMDGVNIMERVFQRGSAGAETFWGGSKVTGPGSADPEAYSITEARLSRNRCNMLRRGVALGPVISDWCPHHPVLVSEQEAAAPANGSSTNKGLIATLAISLLANIGLAAGLAFYFKQSRKPQGDHQRLM
jgi:hexosaminidase